MIGSLLMTVCITLANVLAISGHENCCKCDCDAQRQHIYYAPPLEAAATHQFVQPVLINHHLLVQPEVQQNEQRQVHNVVVVEAGGSTAAPLKEAAPLPPEAEEEQQSSQSNKKTRYQYKLTHPHSKATHYVTFQQTHLNKPETSSEENNHYHKDKNIHYKFEYAVNDQKTHDIKHHKEERNGDVVKGEYSLVEDDGNVRTVKYYADWKSGFHAQVHNSKSQSKQAISG